MPPHSTITDPAVSLARRRERSMLLAASSDMVVVIAALAAAAWGNSLMMAAESLRGGLLVAMELGMLVLMRRIHRGRTTAFDYGAGKLEQFGGLAIGTMMGLGGLWVAATAAYRWGNPPEQSTWGLGFAALIGLVNVLQNGAALLVLWRARSDGTSVILDVQVRTRVAKLLSSAIVLVALCTNAFADGAPWGAMADALGSAFVALVMIQLAASLWRRALPSLLDRTLDESRQHAINQVLASHFDDYEQLRDVRSRLSGNTALIEVILAFRPERSIGDIQAVVNRVVRDISALIPGAAVCVIPVASGE